MNHRQRGFDLVYDIREEREFLLEELRLFLFLVVFVLALLPGDGPLVVDLERCDEHACEQQEIEPDGGRALVEALIDSGSWLMGCAVPDARLRTSSE